MKVAIGVEEFKAKLNQVRAVVDGKSPIPVLGCVRVQAKGGVLTLTGNDLTASLEVRVNAKADGDGTILLPASRLAQLIGSLAVSELELSFDPATEKVVLKAGKYRADFISPKIDTFPQPDALPVDVPTFTIGLPTLKQLVDRTIFCVPESDGKYIVSVALLESTGEVVRMVGTDGFKLAIAEGPSNAGQFKYHLPKTAMTLIRDLSGESVVVTESDSAFFFSTATETLVVRKVAGDFVPYQRILPTVHKTEILIQTASLQGALDRTLPLADLEEPRIEFSVAANASALVIKAASSEAGFAADDIEAKVSGEAAEVMLNADHLSAFLSEAGKCETPLVVRIKEANTVVDFIVGTDYRFLIMPFSLAKK